MKSFKFLAILTEYLALLYLGKSKIPGMAWVFPHHLRRNFEKVVKKKNDLQNDFSAASWLCVLIGYLLLF